MSTLFIGHAYIDITIKAKQIPTGDEKAVADDYAICFGGNAVSAAFCTAKLGTKAQLICNQAPDLLGKLFRLMAEEYNIPLHPIAVKRSSPSLVMPNDQQQRAILRARDADYAPGIPEVDLTNITALHVDGHIPEVALHYAKACREHGILTSLDGGGVRPGLEELIDYIDVAIVGERLPKQLNLSHKDMLRYLQDKGVKIGGITRGSKGMLWFDETDTVQELPAISLPPEKIIDTTGAGDIFHGAYIHSYAQNPEKPWQEHFKVARAASTFSIQHLGNMASLPSQADLAPYLQD